MRSDGPTLRGAFERHHVSINHAPSYRADIRAFLTWWEQLTDDPPVTQIDRQRLRAFLEAAQSLHRLKTRSPTSKYTLVKWLRYVSAILHACEEAELIERVPRFPRLGKCPQAPPIYASPDEVAAIYAARQAARWPTRDHAGIAPAEWWGMLVIYLYNVGSRRGEWWRSLPCSAVDLDRRLIVLTDHKDGGAVELKAINDTLHAHLARFLHPARALLFPSPDNKRALYATWHRIQQAAGISVARPSGSTRKPFFGFHELRKTCGTMLCAINPRAAQVTLGHKSIHTTLAHYAGVEETVRRATEELAQPAPFVAGLHAPPPPAPTFRVVG